MKKWNVVLLTLTITLIVAVVGISMALSGENKGGSKQPEQTPQHGSPVYQAPQIVSNSDEKIQRLREIVPQQPTLANRKSIDIMREAAQTRRPEAAVLLTKCLAFNFDPFNQNELRSQEMMLPAIQLLKEFFGEVVAPALYQEAIASDKKWYQDRIALAARAILSAKTIGEMNTKFSLDRTSNPNARNFAAALANPKLEIKFARPDDKFIEQLSDPSKRKGKK